MALTDTRTLEALPAPEAAVAEPELRPGRRRRKRRISYYVALAWLIGLVIAAITAPLYLTDPNVPVGSVLTPPFTEGHLLGTDELGRDMVSRLIYGARSTLVVISLSVLAVLIVGVTVGLIAGYFRGPLDMLITGFGDVFLAFPGLVFLLVINSVLGASVTTLVVGFLFIGSPTFMRLARANTLATAQREYVRAAIGLGAKHRRVIFREILPNIWPPVAAYTLTIMAWFFIAEASLAYLSLSVPPPASSWGRMIAAGQPVMQRESHLLVIPSLMLVITVMSINVLGNFGRDRAEHLTKAGR